MKGNKALFPYFTVLKFGKPFQIDLGAYFWGLNNFFREMIDVSRQYTYVRGGGGLSRITEMELFWEGV